MNCQNRRACAVFACAALFAIGLAGCSHPNYEVAEVDGILTIKGQPGHKVHLEFVPDTGTVGPSAAAETDSAGKFTPHLLTKDGSLVEGVIVGKHKVVLSDRQLSESATGRGIPIRFGPEYTLPSSTPISQEIKPGKQSIHLDLP
jgi:hypothetical protein